ncbi:MAG: metal ABC transporter substrate-binding protein [Lachnospiraceae bacterium]|nr:metal ABC transporter substrate-binding protein [Lachnospiraceae bacterium]
MRKFLSFMIASLMTVVALTGCASGKGNSASGSGDKIKIVTTIFPEYDWTREILGDKISNADMTLLLDNGVDLHNYTPTFSDMAKISECDLFIYVGGESDEWVDDVLKTSENKDMIVINLLEALGDSVKEEEIVEGMEHEHEHEEGEEHDHEDGDEEHEDGEEHDHEDGDEDHEDGEEHEHEEGEEHDHEHEEHESDEHVWLSLKNASVLCDEIANALETIDPENKDTYAANAEAYKAKLSDLDAQYKDAVDTASCKTLLFGDRFPFRYMVDDYGLDYYAAFAGCSTEVEASFNTVIFLAEKADELNLKSVMTIEGTEHKIAETVRDNTEAKDQQILTLDSMQTTTSADIAAGKTYLSIMTSNLEVLKEALK